MGGCVRDFILEKEPHDWDICTDALPEQVMQIFGEKNVIPTGIKHGTVTVLIGNDNYEVTTYRIDGMYSDGRRPDNVEFTQNLIEDLSRRDFSINAMAYNDKIGLIDPFDGISDIKNRRICCVGDPGKRFGEDYLRILRAIRFSSTFGFIIDKHTRMVAAINAPNLRMLANERVGAEIRKILCGRYAADVIDENKTSIAWVIPEIIDMVGCEQNNPYHVEDVFQHTLSAMRNMSTSNIFPAEWVDDYVRCALFFHDIGKPKSKSTDENGCDHFYHHAAKSAEITYDILTRLRFNSKDRDIIVELVKNHDMELVATKACARRMVTVKADASHSPDRDNDSYLIPASIPLSECGNLVVIGNVFDGEYELPEKVKNTPFETFLSIAYELDRLAFDIDPYEYQDNEGTESIQTVAENLLHDAYRASVVAMLKEQHRYFSIESAMGQDYANADERSHSILKRLADIFGDE